MFDISGIYLGHLIIWLWFDLWPVCMKKQQMVRELTF